MSGDIIDLGSHRSVLRPIPGTKWMTWLGQCIGCGHQAMHIAPIPDWAAGPVTPDCHRCGAERAVLPMAEMPEQMNDGSAKPWAPPEE